jgi:endonuclease/exonuclease/phosphatase family metal-dependent hydrolase
MVANLDISVSPMEQRGLLHGQVECLPGGQALNVLCLHLNLLARDRRRQLALVESYIQQQTDPTAPLLLAGDFNDWRGEACGLLANELGLSDVFQHQHGRLAATFPALLPLLKLDRIYQRGFVVERAEVHHGRRWATLSDHALLSAVLHLKTTP